LNNDHKHISICIDPINAERLKTFLKDKTSFFHRHLLAESLSPDSYQVDLEIILDNNTSDIKSGLQARHARKFMQQITENSR
jgi:hypothetical protein